MESGVGWWVGEWVGSWVGGLAGGWVGYNTDESCALRQSGTLSKYTKYHQMTLKLTAVSRKSTLALKNELLLYVTRDFGA